LKLLIAYGSTEGQTQKIAENLAAHIRRRGLDVTVYDADRRTRDIQIDTFDAIIVASPVHQKLHHTSIRDFVIAHRRLLEIKPSAFISVSLSAAVPGGVSHAQEYVDHFIEATGWRPENYIMVAGAVRLAEYDFFKEQILRHVVFKDRPADTLLGRDHEFTDWDALHEFTNRFVDQLGARMTIGSISKPDGT
jgi:menaquinone-dependent protoporphyrinogen oxidase